MYLPHYLFVCLVLLLPFCSGLFYMNVVHLFLSILLFSNSQDLLRFMFASAFRIFLYFFLFLHWFYSCIIHLYYLYSSATSSPPFRSSSLHSTSNVYFNDGLENRFLFVHFIQSLSISYLLIPFGIAHPNRWIQFPIISHWSVELSFILYVY